MISSYKLEAVRLVLSRNSQTAQHMMIQPAAVVAAGVLGEIQRVF